MSQYITTTYIEHAGDYHPDIKVDRQVISPDVCLRVGAFAIHMTAARMAELGRTILSGADSDASALKSLRWMMEQIKDGVIVRDISRDNEPDYHKRAIAFVQGLAEADEVVRNAEAGK